MITSHETLITTVEKLSLYYSKINNSQRSVLEAAFEYNCFPNQTTLMELAEQTGLPTSKVRQWFTSRRRYIRLSRKEGTCYSNATNGNDNRSTMHIICIPLYLAPPNCNQNPVDHIHAPNTNINNVCIVICTFIILHFLILHCKHFSFCMHRH